MIYLGADHRGFLLKEKIKKYLDSLQIDFTDLGATKYEKDDDYPIISFKVSETVVKNVGDLGVITCGSGAGAVIAANKVKGARAALCFSVDQTQSARHDDNINILCLSANSISDEENIKILETYISTQFGSEERYVRRLNQIHDYESTKC